MKREERIDTIRVLLGSQSTVCLATTGEDGRPNLAPLFYVVDGLNLYWFSSSKSEHTRHLAKRSDVAVAIYRATSEWKEICGVQMKGTARRVDATPVCNEITRKYVQRYGLGLIGTPWVAIARSQLYRFQPRWIRYLDNSKYFGYKFEITLK